MKKILFASLILCFLFVPSFAQWVNTGGSTWTSTANDVDLEIKEIQNDVHDRGANSIRVVISTMPDVNVTGSTMTVDNFPLDYPDSTAQSSLSSIDTNTSNAYEQLKTSVTTSDERWTNRVSTGTNGIITAATSATITIANPVRGYNFTFINASDSSVVATVTPSLTGTAMSFFDGFYKNIIVEKPEAITFEVSLPITSTMTYEIQELE